MDWIDWAALKQITAGALTSIVGSLFGRLMHHGERRRRGLRVRLVDLVWDLPVVAGMAFINIGLVRQFSMPPEVAIMAATGLGYFGPRAIPLILDAATGRAKSEETRK